MMPSRAAAGPVGRRRSCSQFWSVFTLTPIKLRKLRLRKAGSLANDPDAGRADYSSPRRLSLAAQNCPRLAYAAQQCFESSPTADDCAEIRVRGDPSLKFGWWVS